MLQKDGMEGGTEKKVSPYVQWTCGDVEVSKGYFELERASMGDYLNIVLTQV